MSGLINSTDCSFASNWNQGCVVTDPSTQSYGAGFAAAGGGMFVTELAEKGVSIWFFPVRVLSLVYIGNERLIAFGSAISYSVVIVW